MNFTIIVDQYRPGKWSLGSQSPCLIPKLLLFPVHILTLQDSTCNISHNPHKQAHGHYIFSHFTNEESKSQCLIWWANKENSLWRVKPNYILWNGRSMYNKNLLVFWYNLIYCSYCKLMPRLFHCFIKNLLRNIRLCFSMLERGSLKIKNLIFVFLHIEILLPNQTDQMTIRPTFLSG